jgi:hypothetical protein
MKTPIPVRPHNTIPGLSMQEKSDVLHAGTSIFVSRSILDRGILAKYGGRFFLWTLLANFVFDVDIDYKSRQNPKH